MPPRGAAPGTTPRDPAQRLRWEDAYGPPGARPSSRHWPKRLLDTPRSTSRTKLQW